MAGGFLPPAVVARLQAGAPARNGSYLGNLAHWLAPHGVGPVFGPHALAQAGEQTGSELIHSFDPRSRAGLANLASLFVGGPKGDATPQMEALGMKGQFAPYSSETGSALDRGLVNEGPIRQGKGYNPSMQKMVERAHTNPFVKASAEKTAEAKARISALDQARVQAVRKMAERQKVDQKIGAAPMAGKVGQRYPEHDAALVHGPSFINHPAFLKGLLQRRYIAGIGHNHLN